LKGFQKRGALTGKQKTVGKKGVGPAAAARPGRLGGGMGTLGRGVHEIFWLKETFGGLVGKKKHNQGGLLVSKATGRAATGLHEAPFVGRKEKAGKTVAVKAPPPRAFRKYNRGFRRASRRRGLCT